MEKAHATRPQQENETGEKRSKEKCNAEATIFPHAQDEAFEGSYMSFCARISGVIPCEKAKNGKKKSLNSSLSAKRQKGGWFYRYFFVNVCENWREESEGQFCFIYFSMFSFTYSET